MTVPDHTDPPVAATNGHAGEWDDTTPLGAARAWLRTQIWSDGAPCPCCKQNAKVYRRSLNAPMAIALITAWRSYGTEAWHLPTVTGGASGDVAKLAHWGLIAALPGTRDDGSPRHGWWQHTADGAAWVQGHIGVPRYAFFYGGRCLGLDRHEGEQQWTVTHALGRRFNYTELMDQPVPERAAAGAV